MYDANPWLIEYAYRRAEERIARSEQRRLVQQLSSRPGLRTRLARLLVLVAERLEPASAGAAAPAEAR